MTEAEWLACEDPKKLLELWLGKISERKLRLCAVAFCRKIWPLIADRRHTTPVEIAEKYADGAANDEELATAAQTDESLFTTWHNTLSERGYYTEACIYTTALSAACETAFEAANVTASEGADAAYFAFGCAPTDADMKAWYTKEQATQAKLLRDIFGNPFRPVAFRPGWRTDTVRAIAAQMYESRDFGAMPILADALQDAGCEGNDILAHCRDTNQVHVRGCWVVDLVLGRE